MDRKRIENGTETEQKRNGNESETVQRRKINETILTLPTKSYNTQKNLQMSKIFCNFVAVFVRMRIWGGPNACLMCAKYAG